MSKEKNKNIINFIVWFLVSFILTQALIYLLSKDNFLTTPMYIFLPVIGFIGLYYLTPIVEEYTRYKNKYRLAIIFAILGLIALFIAVLFYAWQIKLLNPDWKMQLQFFNVLKTSAVLEFIISGIFGIIFSEK